MSQHSQKFQIKIPDAPNEDWMDATIAQQLFLNMTQSIQLESVECFIGNILKILGELFGCQNVYWFEKDGLDQFLQWSNFCRRKIANENQKAEELQFYNFWKPISHEELRYFIGEINRQFDFLKSNNKSFRKILFEKKTFFIFSLFLNKIEYGSFFLISPIKKNILDMPITQSTLALILQHYFQMSIKYSEMKKTTYIDDVTGLYNQRFLSLALNREIKKAKKEQSKFSVLFLDIDYFKAVNDTYGHLVGSSVLNSIGDMIHKLIRKSDYGFRYGGDEFILILSGAELIHAQNIAERLRKQVERTEFLASGHKVNVTVSIGISTFPDHGHSKKKLINLADMAMYQAKGRNRNTVCIAG